MRERNLVAPLALVAFLATAVAGCAVQPAEGEDADEIDVSADELNTPNGRHDVRVADGAAGPLYKVQCRIPLRCLFSVHATLAEGSVWRLASQGTMGQRYLVRFGRARIWKQEGERRVLVAEEPLVNGLEFLPFPRDGWNAYRNDYYGDNTVATVRGGRATYYVQFVFEPPQQLQGENASSMPLPMPKTSDYTLDVLFQTR